MTSHILIDLWIAVVYGIALSTAYFCRTLDKRVRELYERLPREDLESLVDGAVVAAQEAARAAKDCETRISQAVTKSQEFHADVVAYMRSTDAKLAKVAEPENRSPPLNGQ
jgi:predicted Holliday junction resolvase-like endonuclease